MRKIDWPRIVRHKARSSRAIFTLSRLGLGVFLVLITSSVFYTRAGVRTHVYAATPSTLNFQARLLNIGGTVVADNTYSVQFKLYNVSSGGVAEWTETQGSVNVKSGYLNVYLGSSTAFPGTVDWGQEHWLTMNVNGDGEMNPRLKLTAVPYAFRAGQADTLTNGSGTIAASSLAQLAPSSMQTVNAALSAIRLNQTGAGGLLQLQNTGTDVFTVDNSGATNISGNVLAKTASNSATALQVQNSSGNTFLAVDTLNSAVTLGSSGTASTIQIGNTTGAVLQTIGIGNNATSSSTTALTMGSLIGTSTTTIQSGTGGTQISSGANVTIGTNDNVGTLLVIDSKNTAGDPLGTAGAMYYNSSTNKFRCYENGAWSNCIGGVSGASSNSTASFVSGLANVAGTTTGTNVEMLLFTAATTVSNTVGVTGFTAPAAGSFRTCLVKNNAAITAGTLNLRWRVNGVSTGAAACAMSTSAPRQAATALDSGVVTFAAGDTISVAFDTSGMLPAASNDFTVYWTVEYNSTSGSGITLQYAYDQSSSPATITTANNKDLKVTLADTATDSNFLVNIATGSTGRFAVQNNGTDVLSATSSAVTIAAATSITTGGLSLNSTGLSSVGAIGGVSSLTLSGAISGGTTYTGSGDINTTGGALQTNSVTRITNAGGLTNVTADTSILTTGTLGNARGGTGLDTSTASNGQLLIGNGTGFSLATLTNNGGITITNSAGGIGLATIYGSTANTAVQGDTTLTCPSGTGNLTGGGGTITLGAGGSCGNISTNNAVTFSTSVTTPLLTNAGALTVSTTGANDLTLSSGSGLISLGAGTLATTDNLSLDLNKATDTTFTLQNSGAGIANINLLDGSLQTAGTVRLTNAGALQNISSLSLSGAISGGTTYSGSGDINTTGGNLQTNSVTRITNTGALTNVSADANIISTGTLGNARGGTGLDTSAATNGQLLIGNGTGFSLATLTNSGGIGISNSAGGIGLSVLYGATANSAVQGNTTLTCPSGTGNLTGGGGTITLGSGGSCGNISTNNAVTFSTSVTTPLLTNAGALTVSTTGANDLTLTSGSGLINLGATTLKGTASLSLDLNSSSTTTYTVTNTGTGIADLNIAEGSLQTNGVSRLTNSGALQNITNISLSGSISGGTTYSGSGDINTTGGGIQTNSTTRIDNSGNLTNIGNITGTGAVTLSSGGSGLLTLTSASGTIALGSGTLSRTAAGTTTFDLVDTSNTTFALTNSGAGLANLTTDGSITAGNGLTVSANGITSTGNSQFTGDTLFKTSTNSATAIRIQNSNGDNVLGVNTTGGNQNNLITNPSFETNSTGWAQKGTPTSFGRDATQGYNGSASLKITTQATANQGAQYAISGGLALSTKYSASFYVLLDGTSNAMATLAAGYSSDGTTDNTPCTLSTTTVTSSGWTRVNCNFTTPASFSGTPYLYIKQSDAAVHIFYIDGVLLQTDTNTETNYRDGKVSLQGTVVSPLVLQNSTNSTNAFTVQNSNGTNIFNIDTTDMNTMITNPGFESGTTGWTAVGGSTVITRDASQSWLGNASLNIATSATANAGAKFVTGNAQPTQLAISSTYTLSWYAKLSSGTFTDMAAAYARDGTTETNCVTGQTVSTSGWTRFSCTITTDGTAPSATAYIIIKQVGGTARTFYIDGVQLEAGATLTEYGAGSIFLNGTITSPVNFKNKDNSTNAFTIQNSSATTLFQVDTLNNRLYVGNPTADGTGTLLVLDNKNTAGDPAGTNGGEYYNSSSNRFRCYENGAWRDCLNNREDLVAHWDASSTKTNIGLAFVDIYTQTGSDGKSMQIDTNGKTQLRLVVNWNKIGAGTQTVQILEVGTANVLATLDVVAGRNDSGLISVPVFAQNSLKYYKVQAKSTTAADDPIFEGATITLR